jgi:hypothetical protein
MRVTDGNPDIARPGAGSTSFFQNKVKVGALKFDHFLLIIHNAIANPFQPPIRNVIDSQVNPAAYSDRATGG